jgi:hypothetical protein
LDEARSIVDCGVDILDVKEPSRGSLGRADAEVIQQITASLGGRMPVSAAMGELVHFVLRDDPVPSGVTYVKLGLEQASWLSDWQTTWNRAIKRIPEHIQRVSVAYADWENAIAPPPEDVLGHAIRSGSRVFLIDTFAKTLNTLTSALDMASIASFIAKAHDYGVTVALAGSLCRDDIVRLLPYGPDLIAVRGAVCDKGRRSKVVPQKVRDLAELIRSRR